MQFQNIIQQSEKVFRGKHDELKKAVCCLLARGHLLIEDLPGMGKTTFAMVLSKLFDLPYNRIQFTNDLLPADILGFQILSENRQSFQFHKGPIFSELVLADELNRGTPKTQSALLQAMEERTVTMDGQTYSLPQPFFLIATQNPSEHAGTYPLPESQLDRFMMCIELGYPTRNTELEILKNGDTRQNLQHLSPIVTRQQLLDLQLKVDSIHASETLLIYVQSLLQTTRTEKIFKNGLSPRAGLLLIQAAKAWAFLEGRNMVLPEDIKAVAGSVMRHRLQAQQGSTQKVHEIVESLIHGTAIPL